MVLITPGPLKEVVVEEQPKEDMKILEIIIKQLLEAGVHQVQNT